MLDLHPWILLTVLAAAFVQGAIGVGFALIAAPVMAMLTPELVPVGLLVLMLPLNAYVAWRERSALDLPSAWKITLGRFVGTFGGVALLVVLSAHQLAILIGAATIAACIATLTAPSFRANARAYLAAGFVTGVSETATGIGGPPLALVYQHHPAPALRSTIAFCFLVGEIVSLVILAVAGQTSASQFTDALLLVPALAVGAMLSRAAHARLPARLMRSLVLGFAIISAVVLLVRH
jgi:uncharacterized membrane protein YfcA